MTFNYAKSRQTAARLIAKFGQTGAIRRTTPGDGPPHNPGPPVVTDYPATLVVIDYTLRERESTLIEEGDRKVLISTEGLGIEPTVADQVVIGGKAYSIARVSPLDPGGTVVMWEAQARA